MYNEVWWAVFWFILKIEFVIMIIKFIVSIFQKNKMKIAFNAIMLLLFDFFYIYYNNSNDAKLIATFLMIYTIIIFFISNLFESSKDVDNNKKHDMRRIVK